MLRLPLATVLTLCLIASWGHALSSAQTVEVNLKPQWDERVALENPHKGWYHHYPDNGFAKYEIRRDEDLLDFPGMDHLYMRLAWSYLEPEEGQYNWKVIDREIEKWTACGLGIAFRISCRETGTEPVQQKFATPRWVREAGAQGGHYRKGERLGPEGPWEPIYDDPIFMEKLENFLRAFGARYDGKPWIRYVDIGSIGDWGEGHTHSGSRLAYDFDQRRPHVDLYCKYFRKTQLVISDDFVFGIADLQKRQRMHEYIVDRGIAYRDDSILVDYFAKTFRDTWSVRSPEFFADTWRSTPQVLELQHYGTVKEDGNWFVRPGSSVALHGRGSSGADYLRGAIEQLHATYIGYHGYADQWLADNPQLTVELLNRCGYWYFIHTVRHAETWKPGEKQMVSITWENRGVAPAYHPYELILRLEGPETVNLVVPSRNGTWLPTAEADTYAEEYAFDVPNSLTPGRYALKLKLHCQHTERDIRLALRRDLLDGDNFYSIGSVRLSR